MNETNRYFWAGDLILENGSIVMPGNWYRIVSTTPGHQLALREEIYERVRLTEFQQLPSRTKCIFLCRTEQEMRTFLIANQRTNALIYEVELTDTTTKICTVDSTLCSIQNMQENGRFLTTVELAEQARQYWSGATKNLIGIPEVAAESAIKIIKKM